MHHIQTSIQEHLADVISVTNVDRGFCTNCGLVFKPETKAFIMSVHNVTGNEYRGYSVLEVGDTFSQLWLLLPVYRELFSNIPGTYIFKISESPFKPGDKIDIKKQVKLILRHTETIHTEEKKSILN